MNNPQNLSEPSTVSPSPYVPFATHSSLSANPTTPISSTTTTTPSTSSKKGFLSSSNKSTTIEDIYPVTNDPITGYTNLCDAIQKQSTVYLARVLYDLQRLRLPASVIPNPYSNYNNLTNSSTSSNTSTLTTTRTRSDQQNVHPESSSNSNNFRTNSSTAFSESSSIPPTPNTPVVNSTLSTPPPASNETFQPIYSAIVTSFSATIDPLPILLEALSLHFRMNSYPYIDPYPVLDTFQRLQCLTYPHQQYTLVTNFIPFLTSLTNYTLCKKILQESYQRSITSSAVSPLLTTLLPTPTLIPSFSIDRNLRLLCLYNIYQRSSYRDTAHFCLSTEDNDTLLPRQTNDDSTRINDTVNRMEEFRRYYTELSPEIQSTIPLELIDNTIFPTEIFPSHLFQKLETCYNNWLRLAQFNISFTNVDMIKCKDTSTDGSSTVGLPPILTSSIASVPSVSVLFFPILLFYAKLIQAGYSALAKDIADKDEWHRQCLISICNTYHYPKIAYKLCSVYGYNYHQYPNLYAENVRTSISGFTYAPAPDLLVSYYFCAVFANEPLFIQNIVQRTVKRVLQTNIDKVYGTDRISSSAVWKLFYRCLGHSCLDTVSNIVTTSTTSDSVPTIIDSEFQFNCSCLVTRATDSKVYYELLRYQISHPLIHPQPTRVWVNNGQYIDTFYSLLQTISGQSKGKMDTGITLSTINSIVNNVPNHEITTNDNTTITNNVKEYLPLPSRTILHDLLTINDVEKAAQLVHEYAWQIRSSRISASSLGSTVESDNSLQPDVYIGVDAEWSAPLSSFHSHNVALVQISIYRGQYIQKKLQRTDNLFSLTTEETASSPSPNNPPITVTPEELEGESNESPDIVLLMDVPYLCSTVYERGEIDQQRLNIAFQNIFAPMQWLPSIIPDALTTSISPPSITVLTYGGFGDLYCIGDAHPWLSIFTRTYGKKKPMSPKFDNSVQDDVPVVPLTLHDVQALANTRVIPSPPKKVSDNNSTTAAESRSSTMSIGALPTTITNDTRERTNDDNNKNEEEEDEAEEEIEEVLDDTLAKDDTAISSNPPPSEAVQPSNDPSAGGLALLVAKTLGAPLNKLWQMSDWQRRPLYIPQRIYAALDAWVLPRIYLLLLSYPLRPVVPGGNRSWKERKALKLKEKQERKALRRAEAKKKKEQENLETQV